MKLISTIFCWLLLPAAMATAINAPALRVADPFVLEHEGLFYLYGTLDGTPNLGIPVRVSENLTDWSIPSRSTDGFALSREDVFGDTGFWAPSLVERDGRFYMFYTANERIAVAESDHPAGPFIQNEQGSFDPDMPAIDAHAFIDDDGKAYLFFVRLQSGNRMFVAELSEDLQSIHKDTIQEILSAKPGWENAANSGWPITESPSVIKYGGTYYLFYTANDFRNPEYAVGYATASSPIGPWTRYAGNPVLRRAGGLPGTGAGGAIRTSDGQHLLFYHAHSTDEAVLPRRSVYSSFEFVPSGATGEPAIVQVEETARLLRVDAPANFSTPLSTQHMIGTPGSLDGDPTTTLSAVFDGNVATYFDAPEPDGAWVGLDISDNPMAITAIVYSPRLGRAGRMRNGIFQGSHTADFSNPVTLARITSNPQRSMYTIAIVTEPTMFEFVRYLAPNGSYGNVSVLNFYGVPIPPAPTGLEGKMVHDFAQLTWSHLPVADSFNIKRATDPAGPFTTVASEVTGKSYRDSGLDPAIRYYYVISSVNQAGEGIDSAPESVSNPFTQFEFPIGEWMPSGEIGWIHGINAQWFYSEEMGFLHVDGSRWVFNPHYGWMALMVKDSDGGIVLFSPELGWMFVDLPIKGGFRATIDGVGWRDYNFFDRPGE